jgi:hypothetical protein
MIFEIDNLDAWNNYKMGYRKASRIISSCTNIVHLEGASRYIKNLGAIYDNFKCNSKFHQEFLEANHEELKRKLNLKFEYLSDC